MAVTGDLRVVTASLGGVKVYHLSGSLDAADSRSLLAQLPSVVRSAGAQVVSHTVVAPRAHHVEGMRALEEASGAVPWPVTWIDGGGATACVQACAVAGARVRYLERDGRPVGAVWEDADAYHCWLGDVRAADASLSREGQARATFEGIEEALGLVDLGFEHVVRTWLFVDQILEWYGSFNEVRTRFFDERGVFGRFLPASTGIGAANPAGRSVVAQAIALRPKRAEVEVREVESPLQCPATEYRSSFSRAAEVLRGGVRQVYVSGTASIDPGGDTVHRGDLGRQIEHTMAVVEAILGARGLGWENLLRGIVYFKDGSDAAGFERHCRARGVPLSPLIVTQGTVCRDELLFEIEVDAFGT